MWVALTAVAFTAGYLSRGSEVGDLREDFDSAIAGWEESLGKWESTVGTLEECNADLDQALTLLEQYGAGPDRMEE